MGRAPCCEKVGIKRGRWTAEEDLILSNYIQSNGEGSWRSLPKNAGLKRCGKSCRLRWINYLRADLKRGNISPEEEELVVKLHSTLGNRWSLIASHLPGRTDNEIKNYWNSHLSRKLHNFIRKPSISQDVSAVVTNTSSAPLQPKRRLGKTSRSAMKPKTHKTRSKKTSAPPEPQADVPMAEEGALMMELNGAETEIGPYEDYCRSINEDIGVLSIDNDIIDLLLDESNPGPIYTSSGGDTSDGARGFSESSNQECLQSNPSVESFLNYEDQVSDEFIDWDCVWQEGSNNNMWHQKEGPDSMVSWLLDGDDEAKICENLGEPLDHDEENALIAWLLS